MDFLVRIRMSGGEPYANTLAGGKILYRETIVKGEVADRLG